MEKECIEREYPRERVVESCNCETSLSNRDIIARKVHIYPKDYGYVIEVGCKSFVFETLDKLLKYLTEYLTNPVEIESKFMKGELVLS